MNRITDTLIFALVLIVLIITWPIIFGKDDDDL